MTAGAANAVPIFADDYSSYGAVTVLDVQSSYFGGTWTTSPSIDYLAAGSGFGGLCGGFGNCIDLDGSFSPPNAGTFATGAIFAAGTYTLMFRLLGSGRGTTEDVTVSLGDFSQALNGILTADVINFSQTFTTTIAGALTFNNTGGDNIGAILTSVSLDVAAVPVPAAGLLLLGALGGLAAIRRGKKA